MMTQITPAPLNSAPDFVPADGLDEAAAQPRERRLLLLVVIPLLYGIFTLGAWSENRAPQPPPSGPYGTVTNANLPDANVPTAPVSKLMVHVVGAVQRP